VISIEEKLSYSFHLGSNKNRKTSSRNMAKNNNSKTTSLSNNGIQDLKTLAKVDKHNIRKYDEDDEDIEIIKGTNKLIDDVKELYKKEFDESRIEYNSKQIREDRKINDYFIHISNNSKSDLACEIIIELGDKKYWDTKSDGFKRGMTRVFRNQVRDLERIVPNFKVANATIHYDETSPHMHIVGVPVKEANKNGMRKQVGKTSVFTKDSLKNIQDKMRVKCIEAFNHYYNLNKELKEKSKGRNKDLHISEMTNYQAMKEQIVKHKKELDRFSKKTEYIINETKNINDLFDNLKPTILNKNNYVINESQKDFIKGYLKEIEDSNKKFNELSEVSITFDNIKKELKENDKIIQEQDDEIDKLTMENSLLKQQIKQKDSHIENLEKENLNLKDIVFSIKNKFKKILRIFSKNRRNPMYQEVSRDFYEKDIITEREYNSIRKGDYEL